MGLFCLPGSGSGLRIRIQGPHPIRIQSWSGSNPDPDPDRIRILTRIHNTALFVLILFSACGFFLFYFRFLSLMQYGCCFTRLLLAVFRIHKYFLRIGCVKNLFYKQSCNTIPSFDYFHSQRRNLPSFLTCFRAFDETLRIRIREAWIQPDLEYWFGGLYLSKIFFIYFRSLSKNRRNFFPLQYLMLTRNPWQK